MKTVLDHSMELTPEQIASRMGFAALLLTPCMPLFHLEGYGMVGALGRPELWPALIAAGIGMAASELLSSRLRVLLIAMATFPLLLTVIVFEHLSAFDYFCSTVLGRHEMPTSEILASATFSWGWLLPAVGFWLLTRSKAITDL